MRSLSAHLRQPEDHGRLPFHPDCPICREERLSGSLATNGVVTPRTQAALAASLLAFSTAAPAAALAAEPDHQQDGTAAPTQTGSPDSAQNPDFDPGGDSTDLPSDAPPVPQAPAPADPGNDDTGPVDQEPTTNTTDPVGDTGDGSGNPSDKQQPSAPTDPSPPAVSAPGASGGPAPGTPATDPTAATGAPTATNPAATDVTSESTASKKGRDRRHGRARHVTSTSVVPQASSIASDTPGANGTAEVVQPPAAPTPPAPSGQHAKPGDRTHIVLRGESLWSIASDVLGGSASPARVAREVHRLWQLNREHIATADPDVLMIGTRLRLR